MPRADNLSRALLGLILICLVVLIVRDAGDAATPMDAPDETTAAQVAGPLLRFEVRMIKLQRGAPVMLRTDTATGEAWRMGVLSAGEWELLREGTDGVPSAGAETPGRYSINAVSQRRGAPTLVRSDTATGRVWRKGSKSDGPWVAVPNPGEAPLVPKTVLPKAPR